MAEDPPRGADAGCFLCGRPGARRIESFTFEGSSSDARVFRYECPKCGAYDICSIVYDEAAEQQGQSVTNTGNPLRNTSPVEMEAAALESWSRTLEAAERHRRDTSRANETQAHPRNSSASACA